jgi:hypothetical protein
MKQELTAIDGTNINDMRGTAYKGNYLQLSNRKLYFAGMPVTQLRLSNKPLFKSIYLYDIVSNGMELGQIALNERDYKEVQRVLNAEPIYTGTYKVVKIFRRSHRKQILRRGLTRDEAKRVVNSYPDSNTHMVVFCKQFTASKYYSN